jgi:UDP-N-acetyl-D-glucosamine dehydrogenase
MLHQKGALLSYTDPIVPQLPALACAGGYGLESVSLDPAMLASVDAVAILTDHTAFDYDAIVKAAPLVIDTRNAVKGPHPHVFRLGAPKPASAELRPAAAATANRAA